MTQELETIKEMIAQIGGWVAAIILGLIGLIKYAISDKKDNGGIYGSKMAGEIGILKNQMTRSQQDIFELRNNHEKHQEEFSLRLGRIERMVYKIGLKLKIKDTDLFD